MKIEEESVEKDYLEDQIEQFSKRNINYKFRDYVQELSSFINKETLSDDERKNIEEEVEVLKKVISQLQFKHGIDGINVNNKDNINTNKTFK